MAQEQGFPSLETPFVLQGARINQPWYRLLLTLWTRTGGADGVRVVLPGSFMSFAGPVIPSGYLDANGQAVSRITFSALFAAIGTTHGSGDGSTTFNLPDAYAFMPTPAGVLYIIKT